MAPAFGLRVHVNDVHGLRVLDDEIGSAAQVDLTAEARLDHAVYAAVIEDILGLRLFDDVHLVRRIGGQVLPLLRLPGR